MAEREFEVSTTRVIDAPSDMVWALVSDTNRVDRAIGLSAGKYSFEQIVAGDPDSRERVAEAKELGLTLRWIEPPYEWIEGRSVRGERRFIAGPVTRGGFDVTLEPQGEKTLVRARIFSAATNPIGKIGFFAKRAGMRRGCERYLESIAKALTDLRARLAERDAKEPASAFVRRTLLDLKVDTVSAGPVSTVDEHNLGYAAKKLFESPVPKELRDKIVALLKDRADDEVQAIRPFELAHAWHVERRAALRAFLYAARAGLVDLRWQLNCPTCRVGAQNETSLGAVKRTAHCDSCNIDFDVDFAKYVEAVFSPNASIRKVDTAVYCASSPWFRPHIFAQLRVDPGQTRVAKVPLPVGELLLRTLKGKRRAELEPTSRPAKLTVALTPEAMEVESTGVADDGADTELEVVNRSDEAQYLLIERAGWSADIVLGSTIASMPEFVDLFSTEAPASGVELTVSSLTILFSDLTGSTAMYERLGDARAFALVQEHFDIMLGLVAAHGGAVIKTMGDAVMASFASPADAARCSVEMVRRCHEAHAKEGLTVKLGFHEGPCLAVRANDRLDYFGTTVNVAARLQAQAHAGEVVVTKTLANHPAVAAVLGAIEREPRTFDAHLKGIKEVQVLIGYDCDASA
ncbi:MAG: SRPBCC family protein [Myxococcales bacterium]|nr:SRPBCC family protein [Myxococcales bacterium]